MELEVYDDSRGFDVLQAEWNQLLQCSVTNVPFLSWEWQRAWWDAFGEEGAYPGQNRRRLRLLTARDEDGRLKAIAPLFIEDTPVEPGAMLPEVHIERPAAVSDTWQRTLYLIGGTEVSDYLDFIAPAEFHREACMAFIDALAGQTDWQAFDLHCVPGDSPTLAALDELARAHGWDVEQAREEVCPVVELPGTWEEYMSFTLDKKQRHELRRKMRRAMQETRVEWYWVERAENLEQGLETFFQLHKASQRGKDAFMDEHMQGFFRNVARLALEKGWLRLSILTFNSQPVASYLNFDYGHDRLVYNSGYDPDAYADLAPGVVLVAFMIEDAIQHGLKRFDFLRGGERYKYEFGPTQTEVRRMLIRR